MPFGVSFNSCFIDDDSNLKMTQQLIFTKPAVAAPWPRSLFNDDGDVGSGSGMISYNFTVNQYWQAPRLLWAIQ
jgi:hypothetical protein